MSFNKIIVFLSKIIPCNLGSDFLSDLLMRYIYSQVHAHNLLRASNNTQALVHHATLE